MKWLLYLCLFLVAVPTRAQIDTSSACWKQQTIPSFNIFRSDSSGFTHLNLQANKKTVFMLFSPDCEHCIKQVELILKNSTQLKTAQWVLVTTSSLDMIRTFEEKYKIADYPFITVCRDPKLFFGVFFKLKQVPMLAFYGNDGRIKKLYNNGATLKQMRTALTL